MNDHDIRSALGAAVHEAPPVRFTSAALVHAGRTRRRRRRVTAAAVGAALGIAALVAVPVATGGHRATPPATQRDLADRLDTAVRAATPGGAALAQRRVAWTERELVTAEVTVPASWSAIYSVTAATHWPEVSVAAIERWSVNDTFCTQRPTTTRCERTVEPDGSVLVSYEMPTYASKEEQLLERGVDHYRVDGSQVGVSEFVLVSAPRYPLTVAQLAAIATDPDIAYHRPSDAPPAPTPTPTPTETAGTPPSTAPTASSPPPPGGYPVLPVQQPCRDRGLSTPAVAALEAVVRDHLQRAYPGTVTFDSSIATQHCLNAGAASRTVSVSGRTADGLDVSVDVELGSAARTLPSTRTAACTEQPLYCQVTRLGDGRTFAEFELDTGPTGNQHGELYDSPYLTVYVISLPVIDGGHVYPLSGQPLLDLAADPRIVDIARQLAR
jgi:hypothetical protein